MVTWSDETAGRWSERVLGGPSADEAALLLVEGPAGTGKTRLAARLVDGAAARSIRSVTVSFSSSGATVVSRPRPGTSERPPGSAPPSPADLPGALAPLLERGDRFLLVAEDVHRADGPALELLRRLLDRPPARLAAVVTYRPEELPEPGLALGRGAHFPSSLAVSRLRLGPLDAQQVRELVEEGLGPSRCPSDLVTRVQERSGGVPQVVADVVRLLCESGDGRERYS
ncbi:AAA family ATPase, partial [Streptomyces pristinaespiralis]